MTATYIDRLSGVLKRKGVSYAFGVSGSGASLDVITSLEEKGVKYFPVAHEASAALMAGACCRKGKVNAVAISIKGPGFINLVPGILSNYYECRPALTISEAYGDKSPGYLRHKRLAHFSVVSSIIKGFASASDSPDIIRQLINVAHREIPGPVHIDLSQNEKVTTDIRGSTRDVNKSSSVGLDEILFHIRSSKKPAIVLGSLTARCLLGFPWEDMGVPVTTTVAAKGAIDEYCPFSGGVITGEAKELSTEQGILNKADLIIAFGLRNTEVIMPTSFRAPLIIIDVISGNLHEGFRPDKVYVTDNIDEIAYTIKVAVEKKSWGDDVVATHWEAVEEELLRDSWLPAPVFRCLQETLGENVILTLDTGLFCIIGETIWKTRKPEDFCGSSIGRFMGTSIPTAIGAALSSPGNRAVCVAGDGGIRPYLPEIKLAVEEKIPILFILMADGCYGTIALSARGKKSSSRAFEVSSPEWWRVAGAMGCKAIAISDLGGLQNALKCWMETGGPLFMEMSFDKEKYMNSILKLR